MKYPYTVQYMDLGRGSEPFPIIQLPQGFEAVTSFLLSDVQTPDDVIIGYYLSALDDVLQDRLPYQEAGGNVFRLEIHGKVQTR